MFHYKAFSITLDTYYQEGAAPKYIAKKDGMLGICVEIINAMNTVLLKDNIGINLKHGANFKRITEDLKSDKISIFCGMVKTPEYEQYFEYGGAIFDFNPNFAVAQNDTFNYIDNKNLQGRKIGVLKESHSKQFLEDHYFNFRIMAYDSLEQALKVLKYKRVDALIHHDIGLSYQTRALQLNNDIKLINISDRKSKEYLVLSKNLSKGVRHKINNAFQTITENGTKEKILMKFSLQPTM